MCIRDSIECILDDEATMKTVGQDVLETALKKGRPLCWLCAMHKRLHKNKWGTALDSWWEQKLRSTMQDNDKIQSGDLLAWRTQRCLSHGNGKETAENILSDMLVTEWTKILCCSGLAQREVGRFWLSFREKTAGFGSVLSDHFYRATACNATHGIAVGILSVRPSVRLSVRQMRVLWQN